MKQYIAHYFYRTDAGKLESNLVAIAANSMTEARRIAKARVGGKTTLRLVDVLPAELCKPPTDNVDFPCTDQRDSRH